MSVLFVCYLFDSCFFFYLRAFQVNDVLARYSVLNLEFSTNLYLARLASAISKRLVLSFSFLLALTVLTRQSVVTPNPLLFNRNCNKTTKGIDKLLLLETCVFMCQAICVYLYTGIRM